VRLERDTLDGRFLDLDGDGALLLGMPGGSRRIAAGEVFPVTA
jgi:BirA family biotin operon repressor/biotin-[acetyl-CoA-carboxylase] ligase